MTIIYNPNIGIITKIIFKIEIRENIEEFSKQQLLFFSQFSQRAFPSHLCCVEWLKLHLHSLNESQKHLRTDGRDELQVVNTTGQGG